MLTAFQRWNLKEDRGPPGHFEVLKEVWDSGLEQSETVILTKEKKISYNADPTKAPDYWNTHFNISKKYKENVWDNW